MSPNRSRRRLRQWIGAIFVLGAFTAGVRMYVPTVEWKREFDHALTEPLWTGTYDLGSASAQRIEFEYHSPSIHAVRLDLAVPTGETDVPVLEQRIAVASAEDETPVPTGLRPSQLYWTDEQPWASIYFDQPAELGPASVVLVNIRPDPRYAGVTMDATLWSHQCGCEMMPVWFGRALAWGIGIVGLMIGAAIAFWPSRR